MLLVIDSGNTNVVFALYDGRTQVGRWRASSDPRRTADEYAVWLTQLMNLKGFALADVEAAVMANVVPAADYALRTLCQRYVKGEALVVGDPGVEIGVEARIDRPEQVGADRLVNALSSHAEFGGPLVVIDFGTATTFDIVGEDGAYEGGVIAPGIHLSVEALYMAAAKLPRISVEKPQRVIGKATVPAMQSGVFWGYVGLIEGLLKRIREEDGRELEVVATGGLAAIFVEATECFETVDLDLTLKGLVRIYELNRTDGR
ncbi:MAG: type III pantothenate kinase [Rhodovibrionaceae bacterium]|nr:type III pantothenate kinase [Rhodovibrionaceae bacterium]